MEDSLLHEAGLHGCLPRRPEKPAPTDFAYSLIEGHVKSVSESQSLESVDETMIRLLKEKFQSPSSDQGEPSQTGAAPQSPSFRETPTQT